MKKLKIAYFGTPDFSANFLDKILKDSTLPIEVAFVVTQPDKKVGKKQILTPSSVKQIAKKNNIQVFDSGQARMTEDIKKMDLILLFAYGEIIKKDLLERPKFGFWNIHPSLLPKYRGASPVAGALMNGEKETGVTLMKMDEVMDHGSIITQEKLEIQPKERRPELTSRLVDLAFEIFKKEISRDDAFDEKLFKEQDHSKATYTKILSREDGYVEISKMKYQIANNSEKLFNLFRGLYPWPGVWTKIRVKSKEKRVKIVDMDLVNGKLELKKVQLEGKNEVDFKTFNNAYEIFNI